MTTKKVKIEKPEPIPPKTVHWNPWVGVLCVIGIYGVSQIIGLAALVYPLLIKHWSTHTASNWLTNSIFAQFFYILIVESFTVFAVLMLVKMYKLRPNIIGLRRPKWSDLLYGLGAVPVYYVLYFVAISVFSYFDKGLNINQQQNVGFSSVHGVAELVATFISLVILPPIAEEILVRGLLYSSLKKGIPQIGAALLTSAIFASAHLPEGVGGLLWVGAIDTFILSMVLIYLREKTGGLWASMTLHGIKNGVAYVVLYIATLASFHF